jgi:hypothetical protein
MFSTVVGILALVGFVLWLSGYVRARQLRSRGVMVLARLVSLKEATSAQAGQRFFTLRFETLPPAGTPQSPAQFTHTRSLATAPKPGRYGVLFDPVEPSRSRVILT